RLTVRTARHDPSSVRAERYGAHGRDMLECLSDGLAGGGIPHTGRPLLAGRDDPASVRAKRSESDGTLVRRTLTSREQRRNTYHFTGRGKRPDLRGPIGTGGDDPGPVRIEADRVHWIMEPQDL